MVPGSVSIILNVSTDELEPSSPATRTSGLPLSLETYLMISAKVYNSQRDSYWPGRWKQKTYKLTSTQMMLLADLLYNWPQSQYWLKVTRAAEAKYAFPTIPAKRQAEKKPFQVRDECARIRRIRSVMVMIQHTACLLSLKATQKQCFGEEMITVFLKYKTWHFFYNIYSCIEPGVIIIFRSFN